MKRVFIIFGWLIVIFLFTCCGRQVQKQIAIHEIQFEQGGKGILPSLYSTGNSLYLSWVDTLPDSSASLALSELNGSVWAPSQELARGKNWFINWADFPTISVNKDFVFSHYLQNVNSAHMAYDIKFGIQKFGTTRGAFNHLNQDGTASEHGFVSVIPFTDTTFFVSWLDGRNMGEGHGHVHDRNLGAMNVRAAEIAFDGTVRNEVVLDHMACTCCQTTATLTSHGPVVLYRDCTLDNIRDIVITRKIGDRWTEPRPIHLDNWKIEGCPVNGPRADAMNDDLAVAWFTEANGTAKVLTVFSKNGGETFESPILVSDNKPLGRVDIVMINNKEAIVSWMETEGEQTYLYAQKINNAGEKGTPICVTAISANRKSGFPQMETLQGKVYFAWTDYKGNSASIKTAFVRFDEF